MQSGEFLNKNEVFDTHTLTVSSNRATSLRWEREPYTQTYPPTFLRGSSQSVSVERGPGPAVCQAQVQSGRSWLHLCVAGRRKHYSTTGPGVAQYRAAIKISLSQAQPKSSIAPRNNPMHMAVMWPSAACLF
ncbi:hypothetical protein RRG08_052064 [Elysia crispata]|uniref:Uncharacterized protein n=1 Tax=Elysia crispata TaxID=231223 RepID=A0AAE1A4N7_9GAST|nr:hypothetical protein RRG08_052064 [Elysia crispata]